MIYIPFLKKRVLKNDSGMTTNCIKKMCRAGCRDSRRGRRHSINHEPSQFSLPFQEEPNWSANSCLLRIFILLILPLGMMCALTLYLLSPELQSQVNDFLARRDRTTAGGFIDSRTNGDADSDAHPCTELTFAPSRTPITAAPTRTATAGVSATPGSVSSIISVSGNFKDVRFIGVDGMGRAVVSEYQDGRIMSLNMLGTITTTWSVPDSSLPVTGMAVDRNGIIYVAQGSELARYDATGKAP